MVRSERTRRGYLPFCYIVTSVVLLAAVLIRLGHYQLKPTPRELGVSVTGCLSTAPPAGGAEALYTVANQGTPYQSAWLRFEFGASARRVVGAALVHTEMIGPGISLKSGVATPLRRPPSVVTCNVTIVA